MARIDDFGEHIAGAAKERRAAWAERMGRMTAADVAAQPLSRSFPEPDWKGLIDEGLDPWLVSVMRAMRDAIPAKPRGHRLTRWLQTATTVRGICIAIADGSITREALEERARRPDQTWLRMILESPAALYLAAGHDRNLKAWTFGSLTVSSQDGVRLPQPQRRWVIYGPDRTGIRRGPVNPQIAAMEPAEALDAFRQLLEREDAAPAPERDRKMAFEMWYVGSDRSTVHIGRKIGKDRISLATRSSPEEARAFLRDGHDELVETLERARRAPDERGGRNEPRLGPDRRGGRDVTPEIFMATFGFRGVQFGNYVEDVRRQGDLNRAYDALIDMAEVMRVPPASLSLGGSLGLAFGARGKGGVNAAAAHYEPDLVVINLTKGSGAGSLAHEWFHGLDNYISRRDGRVLGYATDGQINRTGDMIAIGDGFRRLAQSLARTGIAKRAGELDRCRATPYWSQPIEIAARAFEAWIIDSLSRNGQQNDYLANIVPEEVYEAEARIMMAPAGRYPYPKQSELSHVRAGFEALFMSPGLLEDYDPADRTAPVEPVGAPDPGRMPTRMQPAGQSQPSWLTDNEPVTQGKPVERPVDHEEEQDVEPTVWM